MPALVEQTTFLVVCCLAGWVCSVAGCVLWLTICLSLPTERTRYLESTVSVLKAKSQALFDFNARQNQKLMQENMELIADIKDLRQAIKNIRLAPLFDATPGGAANSVSSQSCVGGRMGE